MQDLSSTHLFSWMGAVLWPLIRILGIFTSAPVFSHRALPRSMRVGLAFFLALIVAPQVHSTHIELDALAITGWLTLAQEFLIGLGIGLAWRIVFSGIELAGEMISSLMGLGFASLYDPLTQARQPVISQWLSLLAVMVVISADLHLVFLQILLHSFQTLPIGIDSVDRQFFRQIAFWGGHLFAIGVQLSLPLVTALLIVNMALGILTKAAPQLNIFSIGFPATLLAGFGFLSLQLPYWREPMLLFFQQAMYTISDLTRSL